MTMPRSEFGRVDVSVSASAPTAAAIQPTLTPVQNLIVDGRPAAGPAFENVPLTPTVSWTAPAIGAASFYSIQVGQLSKGIGNSTRRNIVGSVLVDERRPASDCRRGCW